MPRAKPKPLTSYPADWVYAMRNAERTPGVPVTVAQGNGEVSYTNTRARLIAMRNGIKQFEPHDSPLQRAAMTQNLAFSKAEPIGDYDWRLTVTFSPVQLRPSEEYAKMLERYLKNLQSSSQ